VSFAGLQPVRHCPGSGNTEPVFFSAMRVFFEYGFSGRSKGRFLDVSVLVEYAVRLEKAGRRIRRRFWCKFTGSTKTRRRRIRRIVTACNRAVYIGINTKKSHAMTTRLTNGSTG